MDSSVLAVVEQLPLPPQGPRVGKAAAQRTSISALNAAEIPVLALCQAGIILEMSFNFSISLIILMHL